MSSRSRTIREPWRHWLTHHPRRSRPVMTDERCGVIVTAAEVQAWAAAGESLTLEFKGEARGALNDRSWWRPWPLANGRGGMLLIGVEDDA